MHSTRSLSVLKSPSRLSRMVQQLWTGPALGPTIRESTPSPAEPPLDNEPHQVQTQAESPICTLPHDIFVIIFGLVGVDDLLACQQVCRMWAELLKDDLASRYRIELAAAGMIDGPPGGTTLAERHNEVRAHRLRSQSAAFHSDRHTWPAIDNFVQVLVCGGTVLYAVYKEGGHSIEIRSPPSAVPSASGSAVRHLSIRMAQSRIEALDTSQDLLVISEVVSTVTWTVRMHMLSSRTGERHPVAASATLDTVSHRGLVFPVKIYRQYVVWQASVSGPSDSDVEIWDWQAGQLIWRKTLLPQVSYTFLNDSYILVTALRQEEVEVYRFRPSGDAPQSDEPILVLELPLGAFRCSVHHDHQSKVHSPSPDARAPFLPDPMLAVIPVRFAIYAPTLSTTILLVPGSTFREQLDRAHELGPDEPRPFRVFWHEWGKEGSLMLNMSGHRAVALCPYGSRVALVHQDQKMKKTNSGNIVIIDLNPWTARHGREVPASRDHGRLTPLKDISCFQYDKLRATVPYVAYQGPQVSFPEDHEPTLVTTNRDGWTVVHEYTPPYRERLGLGYHTYTFK